VHTAGAAFVAFDVWRYEGTALRRQFLRDVAESLKASGYLKRRYRPKRELRALEGDVTSTEYRLGVSGADVLVAVLQAGVVFGLSKWFFSTNLPQHIWGHVRPTATTADRASFVLAATAATLSIIGRIFRVIPTTISMQRLDEPGQFLERFTALLKSLNRPRLVVAIDNLDRCSPDLVDQLLATIKTYLDPAGKTLTNVDVVFLIAADEKAIRRHMTARELERRTAAIALTSSGSESEVYASAAKEASDYVDEFLRKFFSATIPLKDALDEELRDYARAELEPFIRAHEPADPTEGEGFEEKLVGMVVQALRKNPRRLKQFINSLETKLRLLKEREESGAITGRVSADVLGVAKVTIIEEEFAQQYGVLVQDPRKLREWHDRPADQDARFAAFLRSTPDVIPESLEAILTFKQSSEERELPGFTRFRDALLYGAFDEASEVLSAAPEEKRDEYGGELRQLFTDNLQRRRVLEARNLLDAALTRRDLYIPPADATAMVAEAAQSELAPQLTLLDPTPLFAAMPSLTGAARRELLNLYATSEALTQATPERGRVIAEGIVKHLAELSPAQRDRLGAAISSQPAQTQAIEPFVLLASADPQLLREGAGQAAWQTWSERGFAPDSPALQMIVLSVKAHVDGPIATQTLNQIVSILPQHPSPIENTVTLLRAAASIVRGAVEVDETSATSLVGTTEGTFAGLIQSEPLIAAAILDVIDAVIRRWGLGRPHQPQIDGLTMSIAQTRPHSILEFLNAEEPSDDMRAILTSQLQAAVSAAYGADVMADAAEALLRIDPNQDEWLGAHLTSLVNAELVTGVAEATERVSSMAPTVSIELQRHPLPVSCRSHWPSNRRTRRCSPA
jgi:hypothetical protein